MKIGIVNYGIGNVGSVHSALSFYKYDLLLVNNARDLKKAGLIVLAGVGNFSAAVSRLKKLSLWEGIDKAVREEKRPVLGICLGMHLFAHKSYEGGENKGFGWIKAEVVKLKGQDLRLPHMGWNNIEYSESPLFGGLRYNFFYFMHSYQFVPEDEKIIAATASYGETQIAAVVKKDNIVGVQFHPEKSQGDGLRLLRNIIEAIQ
jgi:glutamine amidotransferase